MNTTEKVNYEILRLSSIVEKLFLIKIFLNFWSSIFINASIYTESILLLNKINELSVQIKG